MRKSFRFARLTAAAVIAAVGLSILGIGVALAAPGKSSARPVKVSISHEKTSKDLSRDKASSRDGAVHAEQSAGMRDH
jgi:hypothetical protein